MAYKGIVRGSVIELEGDVELPGRGVPADDARRIRVRRCQPRH